MLTVAFDEYTLSKKDAYERKYKPLPEGGDVHDDVRPAHLTTSRTNENV